MSAESKLFVKSSLITLKHQAIYAIMLANKASQRRNIMRKKSLISILTAALMLPVVPFNVSDSAKAAELTDSGLSYDEIVGTVENPGAGYTTTVWAHCAPGDTPVYDPHGSLVLFFINIEPLAVAIKKKVILL